MPTFFGTQSLNQFQPIQIGGGTASTGPQQPGGTQAQEFDYDTALGILAKQMEQPQAPNVQPPPVGARVLAGIADALLTYASVRLGGPATMANTQGIQQDFEQKQQQAAQARELGRRERNQARLQFGMESIRAGVDAAKEDRERRLEEARKVGEFNRSMWKDAIKEGIVPPEGVDIEKLTAEESMAMISGLIKSNAPEIGGNADAFTASKTLLKLANEFPDLEPSVELGDDGKLKFRINVKKPDKPKAPTGQLTEGQILKYSMLTDNPNFGNLSPDERAQEVVRVAEEMKQWVELKDAADKEYRGFLKITSEMRELESALPDLTQGKWFATKQSESDFRAKAANVMSIIRVQRAGTAQSAQELKAIDAFMAALGKLDRNNISAITTLIDFYDKETRLFETSKRIPPSQRRAMRAAASGIAFEGDEPDPSEFEFVSEVP